MKKKGVLKNISVGDEVKRRGFDGIGLVEWFNKETRWVRVKWNDRDKLMICHLFELEMAE